jgi:NAD(P)-dependent dehydrogenase (short-subunit alcohol dehydrogenase family)
MRKVAIVTGGNRGIGFELCKQLGRLGKQVVLTSRDEQKGVEAAEELKKEGLNILFYKLDVIKQEDVDGLEEFLMQHDLIPEILINNAGIYLDKDTRMLDLDENDLKQTVEVNFMGAFRLMKKIIPLMFTAGYGRIVNVSSGYGSINSMDGGAGAYKISKAALNAMTRIMADEVDERLIKINCVDPGWVNTDMGGDKAPKNTHEAAEGIIRLALLRNDGPAGGFFRDMKNIEW